MAESESATKPIYVPVAFSLDQALAVLAACSVVVRSAPSVGLAGEDAKNLVGGMVELARKTDEAQAARPGEGSE